MVAIVQAIIYFCLMDTAQSRLGLSDFIALSLNTMLIAASGYVINDYYDSRMDRINRPFKWIAGNKWSLKRVLYFYFLLLSAGVLLSLYLALRLSLIPFIFIYPVAIIGLWLYSYVLKCKPIAGNLWVSLFCAGVVLIVALPDWLLGNPSVINQEIWYYSLFAFLATWFREVVKDLEDIAGDQQAGCQTFPAQFGLSSGKILAFLAGLLLLAALYAWDITHTSNTLQLLFTLLQGAVVASMALVWWSKNNSYFHNASLIIKGVMLAGTLLLLIK